MIDNKAYFSTYQDVSSEWRPVQRIGGMLLIVAGMGDIFIKIKHEHKYSFGILKGVIYFPFLGRNLYSSYVATQKIYTLHTDTGCQMLEDRKVVMTSVVYSQITTRERGVLSSVLDITSFKYFLLSIVISKI